MTCGALPHILRGRAGKSASVRRIAFSLAAVLLFSAAAVQGQSRLEQLEATYQTNLRTLHAPVLQDYARQLELLKNQLVARNRLGDAKHVEAEITRVKEIMQGTGVLPYTQLEAAMPTTAQPATPPASKTAPGSPAPPTKAASTPLPTLLAAEAFRGNEIDAKRGAVPLGSAEWRLFRLPAGTYDVLVIFSSEALTAPEEITLTLAGQQAKGSISPDNATGSPDTFRLHRLCQVKLDSEASGSTLGLSATSQGTPRVWIKKIMFTLPKKPAPPAAP